MGQELDREVSIPAQHLSLKADTPLLSFGLTEIQFRRSWLVIGEVGSPMSLCGYMCLHASPEELSHYFRYQNLKQPL